jgi:uncharacterized protein YbjT (DUF2867 family)
VPELVKRGATVRALVRDESKAGAAVGVDGVFHINPAFAPDEAELGVTMVEAAKAIGVRELVFSGAIHPSISKMRNHAAKRPVEEAIYESGLVFVAEAAALALTEDRLAYSTFELCTANMVNRFKLAAMMSEALGRPVEATEPAFDEWAQQAPIPKGPIQEGLDAMYADYDRYGFPGGNALVLSAVLGHEPCTLRQFFRELARRQNIYGRSCV